MRKNRSVKFDGDRSREEGDRNGGGDDEEFRKEDDMKDYEQMLDEVRALKRVRRLRFWADERLDF